MAASYVRKSAAGTAGLPTDLYERTPARFVKYLEMLAANGATITVTDEGDQSRPAPPNTPASP